MLISVVLTLIVNTFSIFESDGAILNFIYTMKNATLISYMFTLTSFLFMAISLYFDSFLAANIGVLALMISTIFVVIMINRRYLNTKVTIISNVIQVIIVIIFFQLIHISGYAYGIKSVNASSRNLKYRISQLDSEPVALIRSGQSGILVARGDGSAEYISRESINRIERIK